MQGVFVNHLARRILPLVLAASLATVIPASPAIASPTALTLAGPTSIVIGTKQIVKYSVSGAVLADDPSQAAVHWRLTGKKVCLFDFGDATPSASGSFQDRGLLDPGLIDSNDCAGSAVLSAYYLAGGGASDEASVRILRAARFADLNASPEPVGKGATVTIHASLQRASWADHKYHAYHGQTATLQFRTLTGSYAPVKAVTGADGDFHATAKQTVSGCWRYVFAGTSTTGPATATGDCVTVK
jgi:hypothetical protein